jgi:hypothetical protein
MYVKSFSFQNSSRIQCHPDMKLHNYNKFVFDKGAKNM